MTDLNAAIQRIRDEIRAAATQATETERQNLASKLGELADLQEDLAGADLAGHAAVLDGLSDLLDQTISDIRANIGGFLLTRLEDVKREVDGARAPTPSGEGGPAPAPGRDIPAEGMPGGAAGGPSPPPTEAPRPPEANLGGGPSPAGAATAAAPAIDLAALGTPHQRFPNSVTWALNVNGISINGAAPEDTGGQPQTVRRVWTNFGGDIVSAAQEYGVPVELIVATICTESGGNEKAIRLEPGYVSDQQTPHRVSPGLMQTLISTAREALGNDPAVNRDWLLIGANSIKAGTAYIRKQFNKTGFDPPVVACAYNAGSVIENTAQSNRWRMRQFPIGTSEHADRFTKWFNDCFRYFATLDDIPADSFFRQLNR